MPSHCACIQKTSIGCETQKREHSGLCQDDLHLPSACVLLLKEVW